MPGVRAAGLTNIVPGAGSGGDDVFTVVEHPPLKPGADLPNALYRRADPGYFSAMEIPLVSGRFFSGQDRTDHADKIIVNQALARQQFPGENPVGRHLHIPAEKNGNYEIVGVVADTIHQAGHPVLPTFYLPVLAGESDRDLTLAVRTAGDPLAISVPVQKQFAALDAELPVSDVLTMQQIIGQSLGNASLSATLVLAFAVLSLVLASVGLYGVLSYLMTQRTGEIGLRIALGAQRGQLLGKVLMDGLRPAVAGLALGLAASLAVAKAISGQAESMLYRTSTMDGEVIAAVAAALLAVAAVACLAPAWRASRVDPMEALRTE
jgi:putative ABC transport system permease protein